MPSYFRRLATVSRFRLLFVTLPLAGHANAIAAVARAAAARGHEVAWAGSESYLRPIVGPDQQIFAIPLRAHRGGAEVGLAAAKSRWVGYSVPHAKFTFKGIDKAVAAFEPDLLAVDQHAYAGAIAAHKHGRPWASLAPTTMELNRPYRPMYPKIDDWFLDRMADVWEAVGMPGRPPHDLRFSPHLLIGFTGAALTGPLSYPDNAHLVGPCLGPRPADTGLSASFPWDRLDPDRRRVLVSMGTLAADQSAGFYTRMAQALAPLADRVQAIVAAPDHVFPDPPPNVLLLPRVPMLELLPKVDAVVGHGGLNTTCEALAHARPLVIAPIKGDQPINAAHVAAAGAGLRLRFHRATPDQMRHAVTTVLDDPSYRTAAARIRDDFAAAGGAPTAAALLEGLAAQQPHPARIAEPAAP